MEDKKSLLKISIELLKIDNNILILNLLTIFILIIQLCQLVMLLHLQ
jgi:hypothetical protein